MEKEGLVAHYQAVAKEDSEQSITALSEPTIVWSNEVQSLQQSTVQQDLWLLYDVGLILLPLLLIVKIGLIIVAERRDAENVGVWIELASGLSRYLITFNSQLVTLFTVIFVTVLSTFVKRYALWRAQQGAFLAELEQFQGSVSLPSAIKLVWVLRSWNVTSFVLVVVWSFYYIGSQAAKNEYRLTDSSALSRQPYIIQRSDSIGLFSPEAEAYINATTHVPLVRDTLLRYLDAQFTKVILDGAAASCRNDKPMSTSSSDGGPLLHDLSRAKSVPAYANPRDRVLKQSRGWQDVTFRGQKKGCGYVGFYNFAGSLVDGYGDSTQARFHRIVGSYTINNASYLIITCSPFADSTWYKNYSTGLNMTSTRLDAPKDSLGNRLREVEYWWQGEGDAITDDTQETDQSTTVPLTGSTICNITRKYVDVGVECVSSTCYVSRMRWANNSGEARATSYSTPFDSDEFASSFLNRLTTSIGYEYVSIFKPDSLPRVVNTYLSLLQYC